MTGKLGQSLRKYTETQGQPDFNLEKFAINSLLSATHTSEMPPNDQEDIVKKVKEAGSNSSSPQSDDNDEPQPDESGEGAAPMSSDEQPEEGLAENLFLKNPPKNNMFQPNSNDILDKDLSESKKSSIFGKDYLTVKLHETFNQDDTMSEPMIEPAVKPAPTTQPDTKPAQPAPSRKNKPFLPMPNVQPDPKAKK